MRGKEGGLDAHLTARWCRSPTAEASGGFGFRAVYVETAARMAYLPRLWKISARAGASNPNLPVEVPRGRA
jgi:hypothetical protein